MWLQVLVKKDNRALGAVPAGLSTSGTNTGSLLRSGWVKKVSYKYFKKYEVDLTVLK